MNRNSIHIVVILAVFSVIGIVLTQFFFLKSTLSLNEKQFHQRTSLALRNVARHIISYNNRVYGHNTNVEEMNPVEQISNNYYIVNVNDEIDPTLLEFHLIDEFNKQNLKVDFEYAIYDCNLDEMTRGTYVSADSAFSRLSGVQHEDRTGCSVEELMYEKYYNQQHPPKTQAIHNFPKHGKYTYYFGVYFPNRSRFYNSQTKAWYAGTGFILTILFFFGYSLSVIIKQRQLSEVQKNFINNLTHEFKTPIASIELSSRVLSDPDIISHPKRLHEYARIIREQNNRLAMQVEKVLQMATIEKRKLQLNCELLNLEEFLHQCIQDFKNSLPDNNYEITLVNQSVPFRVKADPLHFSNLVFNILDNAIKYCEDRPRINVSIRHTSRHYLLDFADNGIGIPHEYRKKIFSRFFRIPTGNVHNVKGFGLGLDYVKKISDRHHWSIRVEDNSPKGSIFIFKIPKS